MEELDKNAYKNILQGYSYEQLVFEKAIVDKQSENVYIKKKELDNEFKRRLEEKNDNGRP